MDNTTKTLLAKKRSMLAIAEATVKKLQAEVAALEAEPDDFEQWLEQKIEKQQREAEPTQGAIPLVIKAKAATPSGRNPRGAVARVIVDLLNTGGEHDISGILAYANSKLANPLTRNSLRTQLMYLRQEGKVISEVEGVYKAP